METLGALLNKLEEKYGNDFYWSVIEGNNFLDELNSELTEDHPLHGKARKALARSYLQDDFLFLLDDKSYAIVHLTFSKNNINGFPLFEIFDDLQSVINDIENKHLEWMKESDSHAAGWDS